MRFDPDMLIELARRCNGEKVESSIAMFERRERGLAKSRAWNERQRAGAADD